jgi:hypothetical protein
MKFGVPIAVRSNALSLMKPQGFEDGLLALKHRNFAASMHHQSAIAMLLDHDYVC